MDNSLARHKPFEKTCTMKLVISLNPIKCYFYYSGCRRVCGPARHSDPHERERSHPGNHSLGSNQAKTLLEVEAKAPGKQTHAQGKENNSALQL